MSWQCQYGAVLLKTCYQECWWGSAKHKQPKKLVCERKGEILQKEHEVQSQLANELIMYEEREDSMFCSVCIGYKKNATADTWNIGYTPCREVAMG